MKFSREIFAIFGRFSPAKVPGYNMVCWGVARILSEGGASVTAMVTCVRVFVDLLPKNTPIRPVRV